ncbi:MAG: restriction endonuclease subunit S [Kiritimatiellae bacterium]|nr:restriction endonuclease subunit S [Kiritimatiellia bacterium]
MLYSLATWINGMAFKNINFTPTGRPVIKIAEIKGGITAQTQFTDSEYDKRYFITRGDMLFSWSGQPETSIDVFYWDGPDGWLNQHVFKVLPDDDACTPTFLYYTLKYLKPNFIGIARNKQTTGLGHVTKADMQAIQVRIPGRPTQNRITHILGKLDARIDVNRRMNRTLERMAAALFKSWFIDFDPVRAKADGRETGLPAEIANIFPDSFEDSELGAIPAGWTVTPMKDLADVNARSTKKDYPHARIRYVDISSVSQGSLDQTTTYDLADAPSRAKRLVQTGDTIWSCVRPNRNAYLYIDRPADNLVVSTGFAVLSPRTIPASYLHQWVTTQAFVDYLTAYATGAAYPAVKADTFETAKMILPGKGILKAFHDLVGPLRARIAHNQRQNRRLAGLRDTLLPKLLSGEIEAPDVEQAAGRAV